MSDGIGAMCDEFNDSDDLEGNDDDFNALGSILSWGEDEDNAVNRVEAALSTVLRERDKLTSGASAPPDMVVFSTKDGVPQMNFMHNPTAMKPSTSAPNANSVAIQLPLPTPIAGLRTQDASQQAMAQSNMPSMQQSAATSQYQLQQSQFNFAQFLAQQAGHFLAQQAASADGRSAIQGIQMMPQTQQQLSQQAQMSQQQAQMQFSDPANLLRQLQMAQFQQFQASQQLQQQAQNGMVQAAQQQQQAQTCVAPQPLINTQGLKGSSAPLPIKPHPRAPPKKRARISGNGLITKPNTKSPVDLPTVSASDTDGEMMHRPEPLMVLSLDMDLDKKDLIDTSHMSASEKAKVNRDRNREHARNTRLRKKAYLEKLKATVDDLCQERDTLVSERAAAANLLVEMHNTRTEVLMSLFALRASNDMRRKLWASILDESSFTCVTPVTPYRSFPASEVQLAKCVRTIMGIDGMMNDVSSLHVLFDSLVDRAAHPFGKIEFQYTLVTEETIVAGNQMMARWLMSTINAVQLGAKNEVSKQGMLCCKFNSSHKIISLELMFDVMAFMLQLKQAAGSDGFAVVPNTLQTCQREFEKPMVLTLAEYPYTIIQVNDLWENLTGYTSDEVVGKLSCSVLQSDASDLGKIKTFMQEVRHKRPASAMFINKSKNGEIFTSYQVVYPLSTDARTAYYLGLTVYSQPGLLSNPNDQLPQSVYTKSDDANQPRFKNSHADGPTEPKSTQ